MSRPEIRNDDVLQIGNFSKDQLSCFVYKNPLQSFLEADKVFEEYNYPCTLVILTEGIDSQKEWCHYIKKNIHRFKLELHGSSHLKYRKMSEEEGYADLKKAKEKLETYFETKITTWYVPFGRSNLPEWGERVCEKLDLKFDVPEMKCLPYFWGKDPPRKQINFHYWDVKQCNQIKNIIKEICKR